MALRSSREVFRGSSGSFPQAAQRLLRRRPNDPILLGPRRRPGRFVHRATCERPARFGQIPRIVRPIFQNSVKDEFDLLGPTDVENDEQAGRQRKSSLLTWTPSTRRWATATNRISAANADRKRSLTARTDRPVTAAVAYCTNGPSRISSH